jgi:hypothetical protein
MKEQEGGHPMIEWMNSQSDEWWRALSRFEDKLVEVLDVYYEFEDKHGGIPAWDIIENDLESVMPWFVYPPGSIPEEELWPESSGFEEGCDE